MARVDFQDRGSESLDDDVDQSRRPSNNFGRDKKSTTARMRGRFVHIRSKPTRLPDLGIKKQRSINRWLGEIKIILTAAATKCEKNAVVIKCQRQGCEAQEWSAL